MTLRRALGAWGCAALAAPGAAFACGENLGRPTRQIEHAQVQLVYKTVPDPVKVGRHFGIDFALCPRNQAALPAEVRVDAHMPEHQHGMNYKPSVAALGNGLYRAEGLMFHMPGRWELAFELRGAGTPLRLAQTLQID
ncbi:MAG: FixH family protein [Rubrivivax sp.]